MAGAMRADVRGVATRGGREGGTRAGERAGGRRGGVTRAGGRSEP